MEDSSEKAYHLTDSEIFDESMSNDFTQQLVQIKTILANSTFNINEIVNKTTSDDDEDDNADKSSDVEDDDEYNGSDDFFEFHEDSDLKNVEFSIKEEDGRISLAYERLPGIPKNIADKFALRTHTLDLSYNTIRDLAFLVNFKILHTLILDNNVSIDVNTLPCLPSLRILWLNKCGINQLSKFLRHINIVAPNIRQLSLMGNPCARTLLNGSPPIENNNYIMCVIRSLPNVEYLDDLKVTDDLRALAHGHDDKKINHFHINFRKAYPSLPNMQTIWKYDTKAKRSISKHGNSFENLNLMLKSCHHYN